MDEMNIASEILHDYKLNNKRMFVIVLVLILLELCTIGGFLWYITLPTEEYAIEQSSDNDSNNIVVGGDYDGNKTEDNIQEEI